MARARRARRTSSGSSASSSSTSPERDGDDDNDSFMLLPNDSQSSLNVEFSPDVTEDASRRREYEERCRVAPVYRLPAELLIHIFSRLGDSKDLRNCMLVSKQWARNSVGLLWHRPGMSKWESIHSVIQSIRKADKMFAYQDLVKRLNLSSLATQVSDGTILGMRDCKRIERLTLTNCTKLTDLSLAPLIEGNRSLLALDVTSLEQVTDSTMMVVADYCLRLQGLNVTGCRKLTDASMKAIAKNCRHLKRLKFNGCQQLTDASIMTVAAHCSHLLEVDLHALQNMESPSITALLMSCPSLREVRLGHCTRIDDTAFTNLPYDLDRPLCFDALRILDLTDCNELGDKGVERIIQTCPRLRNLILAKCRQITDRAVFAITKLGKNLHYIHLGHCARITDLSVEALAKACNRIRYIDLACCLNLTDSSVMKLAGLPKLKRIGLVKCAGITNHSIYSLATGEVKNGRRVNGVSVLERVHLSYCTQLTLDGIHALLRNCPKLTHLSLTGVQAFLQEELLAFCRDAPPEFNDHQRDVFCVFSGLGVDRLREHLNNSQFFSDQQVSANASIMDGSEMGDTVYAMTSAEAAAMRDQNGSVINIHVGTSQSPAFIPILPDASATPGNLPPMPPGYWTVQQMNAHAQAVATASAAHYSQSAPAATGGAVWAGGAVMQHPPPPPPPPLTHHTQTAGAAQVTGMMNATALDDVDEGDEVFGEDSEIMND